MTPDPLTKLPTRDAFFERGDARIAANCRFALAILNIDHFKRFNMHNGHTAGDAVLKALAALLSVQDTFRLAGDTFGVFLDTEAEAENIRARIAASINPSQPAHCGDANCQGPQPPPRVSIGVCTWRGEEFSELLERANAALCSAKVNGRNVVVFAP